MKNTVKRFMIGVMSLLLLVSFCGVNKVSATELGTADGENAVSGISGSGMPYVVGYQVTNETITPGDDFTLTLLIKNVSGDTSVRGVSVIVSNPAGVVPEYGTLSRGSIEVIYPGATEQISLKYSAIDSIVDPYLDFVIYIGYGQTTTSASIRVPVGRVTDFTVEEVSVPNIVAVNRTQYISAIVNNNGNEGASNVVMVVRKDGEDIASANIGTIAPGTTKTQSLGILIDQEGQFTLDTVLTYADGNGENKEYVIDSSVVTASIEDIGSGTLDDGTSTAAGEGRTDNIGINNANSGIANSSIIVVCILGILLIAICCVILLQIYKRK